MASSSGHRVLPLRPQELRELAEALIEHPEEPGVEPHARLLDGRATRNLVGPVELGPWLHIVAVLAIYRCSTMAQTGVSGPVVVDGESFLDALFASAGQG